MARNEFHNNASLLFKKISRQISDDLLTNDLSVIENTLLFAIGIEKLLKSIIYDVNPLYILESPDFKNSVPFIYDSLVKDKSEISKNPNEDVIAFQSSVLRATAFSKTALDNKNTLMKIKNARDIIVHHNFNKLEINELKTLLQRDFYPLLSSFSTEHILGGQTNFFNNLNAKLATISSALQDNIEEQIKLKIEGTLSYWDTLKGTHTYKRENSELKTVDLLKRDFVYPAECPSCKNIAVVYTLPIMEFNPYRNEMIQTGLETKALKCVFCNLEVTDYKELDYLKIEPDVRNKDTIILEYSNELESPEEE